MYRVRLEGKPSGWRAFYEWQRWTADDGRQKARPRQGEVITSWPMKSIPAATSLFFCAAWR